jgi:hypothetical protein
MCGISPNGLNNVSIFIEPTKLVMSGSGCRALFDSMPVPDKRQGRHPGPYQFGQQVGWQLSLGNLDTWSAFGAISKDCREILTVVGRKYGQNESAVIESVVKSLENIVNILECKSHKINQNNSDWFLQEPDDILSTCTPSRYLMIACDKE